MKMLEMFQNRYKVIAVMFFVLGAAAAVAYAGTADVETEVKNFADSLTNILKYVLPVLVLFAVIAGVCCLVGGKSSAGIICFVAAILLGIAIPLSKAILK